MSWREAYRVARPTKLLNFKKAKEEPAPKMVFRITTRGGWKRLIGKHDESVKSVKSVESEREMTGLIISFGSSDRRCVR